MRKRPSLDPAACPRCSSAEIAATVYSSTVEFRGLNLNVNSMERMTCAQCHLQWENESQIKSNQELLRAEYQVARDRIRKNEGLLAGSEIAALRKNLNLVQRDAAAIFGGGANAFNKYESGEVLQSFAMDRLLRLAEAVGGDAVEFLKRVNRGESSVARDGKLSLPIDKSDLDLFVRLLAQPAHLTPDNSFRVGSFHPSTASLSTTVDQDAAIQIKEK